MAVQNSKSRGAVRLVLARAIEGPNAHPIAGHTLTGGSATTAVDSKYAAGVYADDYFNNWEFRNQTKDVTAFITDWTQSSGTITVPSGTANASGDVYEVHSREGPMTGQYNDAIDLAVQAAAHASALADKVDQSLAFQRYRSLYPIPSGFSYLHRVLADTRGSGDYLARHAPSTWDTLTTLRSSSSVNVRLAQSFQTSRANPSFVLGDVYLLLAKLGTPAGADLTLFVEIQPDSSGSPAGTGSAIAVSATVTSTSLPTAPTYQRFTFTAAPVLTADTTYWIVLRGGYDASATNAIVWATDTDAGYSLGSAKWLNDGSTWTALTGDFVFTVRNPYPKLEPMKPRVHYEVLKDTTRYLHLTEKGREDFGLLDGAVLMLTGQGAPSLPTADSSTLEIPYDYAVARAGMHLAATYRDFLGDRAGALLQTYGRVVDDLEKKMSPLVRPGSIEVEAL